MRQHVSSILYRVANRVRPSSEAAIKELDDGIAKIDKLMEPDEGLASIIRGAWAAGQDIDLSGIGYGPVHWDAAEKFSSATEPYYFFLAGLVRTQAVKRVFEVGTHFGGSAQAMLRGGAEKIVTVDITDLNPNLHLLPGIRKVTGDANSEEIVKAAILEFGAGPIDLLYVDAAHDFLPTLTNIGLYVLLFGPRFVVIDDIVLNPGMRSLWNVLRATQGASAVDAVDVVPEIRKPGVGFGILKLR